MPEQLLSPQEAIQAAADIVRLRGALGLKCAPEVQQLLLAAQVLLENEQEGRDQSDQVQGRRERMRRHVSLFLKDATGKKPRLSWRDEMVDTVRFMGSLSSACAHLCEDGEKGERVATRMVVSFGVNLLRDTPLTREHAGIERLDKDELKVRVAKILRVTMRAKWRELGDRLTVALLCAAGLTSKEAWKLIPKPEKMQKHPILEIPAENRKVFDDPSRARKRGPGGGSTA